MNTTFFGFTESCLIEFGWRPTCLLELLCEDLTANGIAGADRLTQNYLRLGRVASSVQDPALATTVREGAARSGAGTGPRTKT